MVATKRDGLEEKIDGLLEQQLTIGVQLEALHKTMRNVLMEMGGAPEVEYREPGRKTIRSRLHDLEQAKHAAGAAGAALGLLFGRVMRWAILGGIVIGALASVLRLFGVGGG